MTGRAVVALAALLPGLAAVTAAWLAIDRRPPEWDRANHLEGALLDYRDDALLAGQVDSVTLEAESALVGEFARRKLPLRIGPVRVRARGVVANPGRRAATGVIELLDVRALTVDRPGVAQDDLAEFLSRQWGLFGLAATVEPCRVAVRWSLPGPDLRARLGLTAGPAPAPFTLRVDGVRYGGCACPGSWWAGT